MTEAEAKTKWCPFARVTTQYGNRAPYPPTNRAVEFVGGKLTREGPYLGSMCMGDGCMAWRTRPVWNDGETTQVGYCGLAGNPRP